MQAAFWWWLAVTLAGWLSWALLAGVLRVLPARGYALARPFGLLLFAYLYWLGGHLGLALRQPLLWWGLAVVGALVCLWGWARRWREMGTVVRAEARQLLTTELLFVSVYALGVACRMLNPALPAEGHPAGLTLLSALLRNPALPLADPWAAGLHAVYPYTGPLMGAVLARLTATPAPIAYNLGLASNLALTTVACYGLLYGLLREQGGSRREAAGRLAAWGAAAVTLLGNWQGIVEYVRVRGVGSERLFAWLALPGFAPWVPSGGHVPEEPGWWLRAGRVLTGRLADGTSFVIPTEFPVLSALMGQASPVFVALPFLALAFAVALEIMISPRGELSAWWRRPRFWGMAWIVGALGPLGPALLPTALGVILAAWLLGDESVGARRLRLREPRPPDTAHRPTSRGDWARWGANGLVATFALGLIAVLCYLPYYLLSRSGEAGVGLARGGHTRLVHYVLLFGPWLVPVIGEALMSYAQMRQGPRPLRRISLLRLYLGLWVLIALALWLVGGWAQAALRLLEAFSQGPWLLLLLVAILAVALAAVHREFAVYIAAHAWGRSLSRVLLMVGITLTLAAELFQGGGQAGRAAAVSGLYLQAWLLLGIGAICALVRLWEGGGRWRLSALLAVLLMALGAYHPGAALYSQAREWQAPASLDSVAFLKEQSPFTYEVYRWLMANAGPDDVLVEGLAAPPRARLSALTGLPTLMGWPEQEAQWRGPTVVAERLADLDTIYRARDEAQVLATMGKYGASLLLVGPGEVETYRITESKLHWTGTFLQLVLAVGDYRLYRVP